MSSSSSMMVIYVPRISTILVNGPAASPSLLDHLFLRTVKRGLTTQCFLNMMKKRPDFESRIKEICTAVPSLLNRLVPSTRSSFRVLDALSALLRLSKAHNEFVLASDKAFENNPLHFDSLPMAVSPSSVNSWDNWLSEIEAEIEQMIHLREVAAAELETRRNESSAEVAVVSAEGSPASPASREGFHSPARIRHFSGGPNPLHEDFEDPDHSEADETAHAIKRRPQPLND